MSNISNLIGGIGIIFVVLIFVIPTVVGISTSSWLWFFSALLAECTILFILFAISEKRNTRRRKNNQPT